MHVLIVDDDNFALDVLENTLVRLGHSAAIAHDGAEAMEILRRQEIHLVITDWDMPTMNGIELCRSVRREDLSGYVYIIMLTGREGAKQRMEGLCAGADDFLNKPLDPEELMVCLKTADRILALETRDVAIFALAKLAESRDSETGAHVERVQSYSRLIAQHLSEETRRSYNVDEEYVRLLYQTSPLHDLGKVAIPDSVLLKPGKLTPDEFAIMKTHTIVGAQTLDAALQRFPNARFLQIAIAIASSHHEKFDGSGYPKGLAGDQIPLCGRIVAVADVYDALTSRRVYKEMMSHEEARAIILRDRGTHFDPEVVDAFLRAEQQILAARERLKDDGSGSPQQTGPSGSAARAAASSCPILVVEDDPVLLEQLKIWLAATGEPVIAAVDGEDAIRLFEEQKPRVVISDWVMPRADGVALCRHIRQRTLCDPVHFIMLTAHSDKARLLDAYDAGVNDFISKPCDPEELLARVRAGIRAAKIQDELVRQATGSQALNAQLATLNSRLERLTITDELTGLFNRRHAMGRLQEQFALVERYNRPLSVAMVDIDHFKQINDTYGHDVGDSVLRQVAAILRDKTRGTDVLCRVGGEEFLIIFPAQTTEEAAICAERCRVAVESHSFHAQSTRLKATVSIGIATRVAGMSQFPDLLKASDLALYAAKHAGRNVVHVAQQSQEAIAMNEPKQSAAQTAPPAPSTSRPPVNLDAVLKRCGGDAKFMSAVTARFCAQAGREIAKIEQALASANADDLRRAAHSLKSMTAYVSADVASGFAKEIEDLGIEKRLGEVATPLESLRAEVNRALAWLSVNQECKSLCA